MQLTKADVRRALAAYHFQPSPDALYAFQRLRSVQFDPIAPAGCNHDLVLQARVAGYQVGDWEKLAYQDRKIYDGWDKQACLIPFEGWPWRRYFYDEHRPIFKKVFDEYPDATQAVLEEIRERGPLMPKDSGFQEKRHDWAGRWHGSSVAKRILRGLWHTGEVMISGRKNGQHVYDLTERIVPADLIAEPKLTDEEAQRELVLERHRAVGIVRTSAPPEVWSYSVQAGPRNNAFKSLTESGELVPVTIEGVKAHATPAFLEHLESPAPQQVTFVAPLDQILWDRKMIAHVYGFDYAWEIYTPESKRRWGYYVLPVMHGDAFVARIEFWCRNGVLEMKRWIPEQTAPGKGFDEELELALSRFMTYCRATELRVAEEACRKTRNLANRIHLDT